MQKCKNSLFTKNAADSASPEKSKVFALTGCAILGFPYIHKYCSTCLHKDCEVNDDHGCCKEKVLLWEEVLFEQDDQRKSDSPS